MFHRSPVARPFGTLNPFGPVQLSVYTHKGFVNIYIPSQFLRVEQYNCVCDQNTFNDVRVRKFFHQLPVTGYNTFRYRYLKMNINKKKKFRSKRGYKTV